MRVCLQRCGRGDPARHDAAPAGGLLPRRQGDGSRAAAVRGAFPPILTRPSCVMIVCSLYQCTSAGLRPGGARHHDHSRPIRGRRQNGLSPGQQSQGSPLDVRHVEVSEAGRQRLKAGLGIDCVGVDEALGGAEVVVLAVPDTHIGKVAAGIEKSLKPGTMVVVLDAAAPLPGICRSARTSPTSSPIPATRLSSTTRRRWRPRRTISAASRPSSTSSAR